jgi:anti-sigma B factor antagonist
MMFDPAPFQVVESRDPAGTLRLALIGELDLAVAHQLCVRLEQLSSNGTRVRLDLSRLEFIDSVGMRTLVRAAQSGGAGGTRLLEVDHDTTRSVRMVIDLFGVAPILWPGGGHSGDPRRRAL